MFRYKQQNAEGGMAVDCYATVHVHGWLEFPRWKHVTNNGNFLQGILRLTYKQSEFSRSSCVTLLGIVSRTSIIIGCDKNFELILLDRYIKSKMLRY